MTEAWLHLQAFFDILFTRNVLIEAGALVAHVLHSDGFGNLILDATPEQLEQLRTDLAAGGVKLPGGAA